MGEEPLGWPVLLAFAQATGEITESWEYEILINMSIEFMKLRREGESPMCIPPMKRKDYGSQ